MDIFKQKKILVQLLILFFLTAAIPLTFLVAQQAQENRSSANVIPATVVVDLAAERPLPRVWQHLSQGGEVPIPQLPPVVTQLKELSPRYVRIDHVFDAYGVVKRSETGAIVYDFTLLDAEIDAILAVGSTPFISLSYIPPDLARPDRADRPVSLEMWSDLVAKTVARYSSRTGKSIPNVYYEVYNEPDLFGKWTAQEYSELYEASVVGASQVVGSQDFFIGGPAVSYIDRSFLVQYIDFVAQKNLRLDFISWHTYNPSPHKIAMDAEAVRSMIVNSTLPVIPTLVVSEWGSYPQKHPWHDNAVDSGHLIATVARSLFAADMLMYFEVKDGDTQQSLNEGGWGIINNAAYGFAKKPRYFALSLLNKLKIWHYPIASTSEGVYVIASGNSPVDLGIILGTPSLGRSGKVMAVTLQFAPALSGTYEVQKTSVQGASIVTEDPYQISAAQAQDLTVELFPDVPVFLDIRRTSAASLYTAGTSLDAADRAALLRGDSLSFVMPRQVSASESAEITFAMKPDAQLSNANDPVYFEAVGEGGERIALSSRLQGFSTGMVLTISNAQGLIQEMPVSLSQTEFSSWHKVSILIDNPRSLLSVSFDGVVTFDPMTNPVAVGKNVAFGRNYFGSIDSISISSNGQTLVQDSF